MAVLQAYSKTSPDHAEQVGSDILEESNSVKAIEGMLHGLESPNIMAAKRAEEEKFKAAVMANPKLKAEYGNAWSQIAEAEHKAATRVKESFFHSTDSRLAGIAVSNRIRSNDISGSAEADRSPVASLCAKRRNSSSTSPPTSVSTPRDRR
jgi:hypothetical protein